ncbi:MAG: hypothetical protein ACMUIE_07105 [Thermoplasmatota archaeon]
MSGITDYLHLVVIGAIVLVVFLYSLYTIASIIKRRMRVRDATREIALLKMDLLSKQAHLENLIEDSVKWSRKDLRKYDDTLEDNKILKSRLDTGMTVADARTKRLELTNETAELFEAVEKIKNYEDRLFEEGHNKGRRGR